MCFTYIHIFNIDNLHYSIIIAIKKANRLISHGHILAKHIYTFVNHMDCVRQVADFDD